MKKRLMSAMSKLTLGVLLFTAISTTSVHARPIGPIEKAAEVKFLGVSGDAVLFNVSVENPTGAKFSVIVLDEDGSELFHEIYSDKKFDKRFKLPKTDKHKLTFVVRNYKDADLRQAFEINTRYVEDVVVTKL